MKPFRTTMLALTFLCGCGGDVTGSTTPRPLVIVPGWAGSEFPSFYADYIAWLVEDGWSRGEIHLVQYPSRGSIAEIDAALVSQIGELVDRYDDSVKLDMLTHSAGHFVGLHALMEGELDHRFVRYIGLAGIAFGWEGDACQQQQVDCGAAHEQLIPFRSSFVVDFHQRNAARIDRLQKCSLFSPADELVRPYDAGRFADGVNVDVPEMGHLAVVRERRFYELMLQSCYGRDSRGPPAS